MGTATNGFRGSFKASRAKNGVDEEFASFDMQTKISYLVRDLSGIRSSKRTKRASAFKTILVYGPYAVPSLLNLVEDYPVVCGAALEAITGMAPEGPRRLSEVTEFWLGQNALDLLSLATARAPRGLDGEDEEVGVSAPGDVPSSQENVDGEN
jgi:hypothetical protein